MGAGSSAQFAHAEATEQLRACIADGGRIAGDDAEVREAAIFSAGKATTPRVVLATCERSKVRADRSFTALSKKATRKVKAGARRKKR